jgi:shikimate dehydrogenase
VLGRPIGHSLSPLLHRAAYDAWGLDWTYEAVEVDQRGLAGFLAGLDATWRGLSLTMPLKRIVVPLLDDLDEQAARSGAVNTVVLEPDRRTGHNTDIPGAATAVRERWAGPVERAVVVGGGATAASVLLALADLGCRRATLLVRDPARAADTVAVVARHPTPPAVDVGVLGSGSVPADILVSTVPAAAQDAVVTGLAADVDVVFEVVYDRWPTPLMRRATGAGQPLVSGLDLLVHQAVLQLELMTGRPGAPLTAMRAVGERVLAGRAV